MKERPGSGLNRRPEEYFFSLPSLAAARERIKSKASEWPLFAAAAGSAMAMMTNASTAVIGGTATGVARGGLPNGRPAYLMYVSPGQLNPQAPDDTATGELFHDARWLAEQKGKAVKIVAPLLAAIPDGLPCRVILIERDLDEVLASQRQMLARRPHTALLCLDHRDLLRDPAGAARMMGEFPDGEPDVTKMAAAVDPALYRKRAGERRIT